MALRGGCCLARAGAARAVKADLSKPAPLLGRLGGIGQVAERGSRARTGADPANQAYSVRLREPSRANLGGAWSRADHRSSSPSS